MKVSGNDPLESIFNSVQIVINGFAPLESVIRKVAKDFEHCWPGSKNGANHLELAVRHVSVVGDRKKRFGQSVVSDERKKGLSINVPVKTFLGMFLQNCWSNEHMKVDLLENGVKERDNVKEDGTCINSLQFAVSWSLLLTSFVQAFPSPFKTGIKQFQKSSNENMNWPHSSANALLSRVSCGMKQRESKDQFPVEFHDVGLENKEKKNFPIKCFIGFLFDQLAQNLHKFDLGVQEIECSSCDSFPVPPSTNQFNRLKQITGIMEGKRADFSGFLRNLKFARLGGVPSSIVGVTDPENEEIDGGIDTGSREESGGNSPQKLVDGLLIIPLSNVEHLRPTLSTVSLTEVTKLVPQLGRSSKDHPDKNKLFSVKDFFRYTEAEGRRFFDELDRDGDGKVNLEDLEVAMRMKKLPQRYAHDLMRHTRSHLFSKSFGWRQFLSLMKQKEPTILQAYTSLCLSKSGTLHKSEILASLKNAGLPANEDNAVAMMRFLNAEDEESISYGHFRDFLLLLPSDRLQEDPRSCASLKRV